MEKKLAKAIEEKRNVEDVISRCKNMWSHRAEAQNVRGSFAKHWKLVEEGLVALYPFVRKLLLGVKETLESSAAEQQSKRQVVLKTGKSLEHRHPDVIKAYDGNPWSLLWCPNYVQGECNIEDWNTIEEIPPP